MSFIYDDVAVFRNQTAAEGQIRHQQGVVDHDDVGLLGSLTGGPEKARGAIAHIQAEAFFACGNMVPGDGVAAQQVDFSAVSRFRALQPDRCLGQQLGVIHRQRIAAGQLPPAAQAEIVGPSLELGYLQYPRLQQAGFFQHGLQRRNVLAHKLFLEIDGVGGHHNPLPLGHGKQGRGEQIGQRFPDAGAAFDNEVVLVVDGVSYSIEHFLLFRAMLESSECSSERSLRA